VIHLSLILSALRTVSTVLVLIIKGAEHFSHVPGTSISGIVAAAKPKEAR
jgi:hypothetical protein